MNKTCFAVMPFGAGFNDIDAIIKQASAACGLEYVRADLSKRPGSILAQIVKEISHAAVVVADITGLNPNVFYELGIAHQLLGPERVVIITQEIYVKQAYDVHQFRQLVYTHDDTGRAKLRAELPGRLEEAAKSIADQESWKVIRGRLSRTKMIVEDLKKALARAGERRLDNLTIRIVAGLSSLAISDNEPADSNTNDEYVKCLLEERDALRMLLLRGARLKAVLNPPRRFAQALVPERLSVRYQRIIGLLRGRSDILGDSKAAADDVAALRQCEFALSPVAMPNLFIIGDIIAYEGMKRGGAGGFEMTHWETDPQELQRLIAQFETFFDDSKRDMLPIQSSESLAKQLQEFYEEACEVQRRRAEPRH